MQAINGTIAQTNKNRSKTLNQLRAREASTNMSIRVHRQEGKAGAESHWVCPCDDLRTKKRGQDFGTLAMRSWRILMATLYVP